MDDAVELWQSKSDDEVLEAAAALSDYTEEGEALIRAELRRRGLPDAPPPIGRCSECGRAIHANDPRSGCAQCGAEWPDAIATILRASRDPDDVEADDLTGPEADLVSVATFPSLVEASLAQSALEAAGIPAFVPDQSPARYQKQFSNVMVRQVDADRALVVLRAAGHR